MKDNEIKVVIVKPHEPAYEAVIKNDLYELQQIVGGWIEITYPFDEDVCVIGNDEAKLIGMEGTLSINDSIYCGPVIIVGDDYENGVFKSLTDEQIKFYTDMFSIPENIDQAAIEADMGYTIWSW